MMTTAPEAVTAAVHEGRTRTNREACLMGDGGMWQGLILLILSQYAAPALCDPWSESSA